MRIPRVLAPLALAASLALPAAAQDAGDVRTLAETYVALPPMQVMLDQMFSPEAIRAQFLAIIPGIETMPGDKLDRMVGATADYYKARLPEITAIMVDTSAEVFSAEELEAMIAFYSTDAGAAVARKSPQVMQVTAARMTELIRDAQTALEPTFNDILQE